ncbi:preprotein translocase SecA family protein [Artemisia annua]|uniref:Protein translocase subunit SecA n=1 Tax=Artemisia annua TaxID=35608 RepID=A0A2U1LJ42_ARTAN|nr:preprotein translocase SecA family protein [Artemisia annua]
MAENLGVVTKTWGNFTSLNYWVVRDYYRLVEFVNSFEPKIQKLSDDQLTAKTAEFRRRLGRGETLADIQAEAFAVVREAAKRKLGMRHFDVQVSLFLSRLMFVVIEVCEDESDKVECVLNDGSIAEMKTGEGKTLVSTLAAYLNALTGEGVHVVTVNDYLAQRDAEWMGRVHRFLGLSVGLIQRGMKSEERRSNYRCDITYTNNSELGFDYLRDNLAGSSGQLVMRWPKPFHFAIVDEVDSVLIDEGRNPLLISGEASKDAARYPVAAKVAELLVRGIHYNIELKDNSVELTEEGINLAEMALETKDLWDENDPWARFVMNALKAKEFYRQDVQYIVKNKKALIINELTGRVEEKRRWSEGIHQAVEAKEGLPIQADSVVVAQITYQSLFKLYPKLSGMTGTAKTEEKEFLKMFQMPVIEVPTNMTNIRNDLPIQAFATARGKWQYVREEVVSMFRVGRPVLVGTTSVENSEYLSALLRESMIPHNVLNARPKYAAREAQTVAQAGRKYAITISTNMAGRGTDIILGGNPKMLAKEVIEDSILSHMSQENPDEFEEPMSREVLSKMKIGPSSLALLAKTALMAKYVSKSENKNWTYEKAKSVISESIEMSQSVSSDELERLVEEQAEMYPLGPCIALAYLSVLKDCEVHCLNEGLEVKRLGGLHVIGTSLHESRRIDNQLRGRAGRQGDPGSTRFMVSLQDEMFQKFNFDTEWAVNLISRITNDEDVPIEGDTIVRQLLSLQVSAEKYFFNIRKSLVEFDEVLESNLIPLSFYGCVTEYISFWFQVQRRHVYDLRQLILTGDSESCSHHIFQYMQAVVDEIVLANVNPLKHPSSWNLDKLLKDFIAISRKVLDESCPGLTVESLLQSLASVHKTSDVDINDFHFPNLPQPPNAFRGIRKKTSSLKRWLAICSDDSLKDGKYRVTANLLRKYLGDLLITSYMNIIEESGYAEEYYAAREAQTVAQAGRKYAITISTNMAGRGTDIILGGNPKMLAKEVIEDSILSHMSQENPDEFEEPMSREVLSKMKIGPSSLALLAKTALMAKYVSKSENKNWTYEKAKSVISESIEMSQSVSSDELERLVEEQAEMYPLGPCIALAYLSVLKDCEVHCLNEGLEVKRLGGLHVIGTSLHESRRIDNQLRGRAGRQGDPGSTRFMVSLQDEMFQKFNFDTEWAVNLISRITNDEDVPIEGDTIVRQLLSLQVSAEKYFFNIRKSLVEFDEVLESNLIPLSFYGCVTEYISFWFQVQRRHVYDLRQLILTGDSESCSHHIFQYMQAVVDEIVLANVNPLKHPSSWNLDKLLKDFIAISGKVLDESCTGLTVESLLQSLASVHKISDVDINDFHFPNLPQPPNAFRGIRKKTSSLKRWLAICSDDSLKDGKYRVTANLLRKYLGDLLITSYMNIIEESGYAEEYVKEIERAVLVKSLDCFWRDHLVNMNRLNSARAVLVKSLDCFWRDHLVNMNRLNSAVNVRSFGHRDPLEEYKIDGCRFFISMLSATRRLTVESLLRHWSSME